MLTSTSFRKWLILELKIKLFLLPPNLFSSMPSKHRDRILQVQGQRHSWTQEREQEMRQNPGGAAALSSHSPVCTEHCHLAHDPTQVTVILHHNHQVLAVCLYRKRPLF